MNSHLLATKLRPPAIPPKRTLRRQLVRRLTDGLEAGRQVTLLSAPAGFGKTVCAGDWVSTLGWQIAWLTLDPADDEPQRFFTYLFAALQQAAPCVGEEIVALLAAGQLPPGDLALAPPGDHYGRSMVYTALATAYELMDDYDRAVEAYQMLIQHGRSSANLVSELLGRAGLALMAMQRGRLRFAFEVASQGIERVERSSALPPISQALYGELGEITYQWHQLELVHQHFQRAIHVATLSGYSDAQLYYDVILSRLHQIRGDLAGAAGHIQHALELMKAEAPAAVREEVVAQQVRVYLAMGRLPEAEQALAHRGQCRLAAKSATCSGHQQGSGVISVSI